MKPALFQGIVSQSRAQLHVLPRAIPNIQTRMPDGRDVRRHDQKEERGHPEMTEQGHKTLVTNVFMSSI